MDWDSFRKKYEHPVIELVKVQPCEYSRRGVRIWAFDYIRSHRINDYRLGELIHKKSGIYPLVYENPDGWIFYQYPDKSLLIIRKRDGQIYTTKALWEEWDAQYLRHQAGILLGILHRRNYVENAKRRFYSYGKHGKEAIEEMIREMETKPSPEIYRSE